MRKYRATANIQPLEEFNDINIQEIREKIGVSQGFLAKWMGVSIKTVQAWESGRNIPNGPSARLLELLKDGTVTIDRFMD